MSNALARTTVNLPADLLQEAKVFAAQNQTTLTELLKQGLSKVLGHNQNMKKKQTLLEYLENYTPPKGVKPLSLEEQDRRYREAMMKKHG